jgi:hypothetical protein
MQALAPWPHHQIPLQYPQWQMSTWSTSRQVNGPGQPLDRRLRSYCQGPVPRVTQAMGYNSINLDMAQFPPMANGRETKYLTWLRGRPPP